MSDILGHSKTANHKKMGSLSLFSPGVPLILGGFSKLCNVLCLKQPSKIPFFWSKNWESYQNLEPVCLPPKRGVTGLVTTKVRLQMIILLEGTGASF